MDHRLWILYTLPEQFVPGLNDVKNIFPYYHLDDFISISGSCDYYVSLPQVIRNKDHKEILDLLERLSEDDKNKGVLVHNIEGLSLVKRINFSKEIITGSGLYVWNDSAASVYLKDAAKFVYPLELSIHELREINNENGILTVYGKTPLMISANCVRNTFKKCKKGAGENFGYLTDRKNMQLPVLFQCKNCYNVIYNALPTSLHQYADNGLDLTKDLLIAFSDEDASLAGGVVSFYIDLLKGKKKEFPIKDFTKAYFTRGVE